MKSSLSPHGIIGDLAALWRGRGLLALMARRELQSRFAGSALGWFWVYAQPVLTVAAYYVVFDLVFEARFGAGDSSRRVGTYLIVGMLPWMAFADALSRGMTSLMESAGLVQKNPLPPVLFPARAILASAATYIPLTLLVSAVYAIKVGLSSSLLALPFLIVALYALVFLCAYSLAILAAALRDVLQIIGFFLSLGIFISPILFPPAMFPEGLRGLLWLNPITPFALGFQSVLLDAAWPAAGVMLSILAWLLAMSILTDRLIRRGREHLVDWL